MNSEVIKQLQVIRAELDTLSRMIYEEKKEEEEKVYWVNPSPDIKEYLSAREVAKRYGVSPATIYRWEREGTFPKGTQWGARTRRWRLADLE